jgi:F0F1-type ATP synthase membrane subunit a
MLFSNIIELTLPGAPLIRIIVAGLFLISMDNKGAGLMSFLEGDLTHNTFVLYNVILILIIYNLLGLVPGSLLPRISMPGLAFFGLIVFLVHSFYTLIADIFGYLVIFVPGGAPIGLLPLLYVIEVVSYVIRPLALVIRICVNIFCGHILLILGRLAGTFIIGIILLELGVAVVQGYVYSMILIL